MGGTSGRWAGRRAGGRAVGASAQHTANSATVIDDGGQVVLAVVRRGRVDHKRLEGEALQREGDRVGDLHRNEPVVPEALQVDAEHLAEPWDPSIRVSLDESGVDEGWLARRKLHLWQVLDAQRLGAVPQRFAKLAPSV